MMRELSMTPRQRQVAELLRQGLSNREIAARLGTAPRTVKAHLNRMYLIFGIEADRHKRVRLAVLLDGQVQVRMVA